MYPTASGRGKYGLTSLTAFYDGEDAAETVAVTLAYPVSRVEGELLYDVLPEKKRPE